MRMSLVLVFPASGTMESDESVTHACVPDLRDQPDIWGFHGLSPAPEYLSVWGTNASKTELSLSLEILHAVLINGRCSMFQREYAPYFSGELTAEGLRSLGYNRQPDTLRSGDVSLQWRQSKQLLDNLNFELSAGTDTSRP